ncbi:uncharacterized protein LOC144134365 [Amblyomma americanum]
MPYMIPPDGLCTFLYYVDVLVTGNKLHGAQNDYSWNEFKMEMKKRSKTKGGISLDIQYIDEKILGDQKVTKEMNALAGNNVQNYGLLTVITQKGKLAQLVTKAKNVLEKPKTMQGNDKNKITIIALGLYDCTDAYSIYDAQFKLAVE